MSGENKRDFFEEQLIELSIGDDGSVTLHFPKFDYDFWLSKKYWTIKEAVCVLMELNIANVHDDYAFFDEHSLEEKCKKIDHEIKKSIADESLPSKDDKFLISLITPLDTINWASKSGIKLPDALSSFADNIATKNKRGRPSAKTEILAEAQNRAESGQLHDKWDDECAHLAKFGTGLKAETSYQPNSIKRFYQLKTHEEFLKIKYRKTKSQ